jgi:hypothetical protein
MDFAGEWCYTFFSGECPMSDEQERLKRLRERQLTARDPLVKVRKSQQNSAERERKLDRSVSLKQAWQDIPRIWRSIVWALLIGGVATGILSSFLEDTLWSILGGIGIAVIFLLFAAIIGNALDTRDEIKRHVK